MEKFNFSKKKSLIMLQHSRMQLFCKVKFYYTIKFDAIYEYIFFAYICIKNKAHKIPVPI